MVMESKERGFLFLIKRFPNLTGSEALLFLLLGHVFSTRNMTLKMNSSKHLAGLFTFRFHVFIFTFDQGSVTSFDREEKLPDSCLIPVLQNYKQK